MATANRDSGLGRGRISRSFMPHIAHMTFGSGPESKWQEEQRQFLQQRLRLLGPILCMIAGIVQMRVYVIYGMWRRLPLTYSAGIVSSGVALLLLTGVLFAQQRPTLQRLRRLELLLLFALALMNFFWCYGWLMSGVVVSNPAPQGIQDMLHEAFWIISPDRITHFRVGPTLVGFPTINNWSLLALVYGVLVPNTWRRGAMVLGLVVLAAVATLVLASLGNAGLRPFLPGNIASTLFLVGTVAMMGLYGSHKFDVLRRAVFDAQQVGQYRLTKLLGKGSMGEVHLAQHRLLRRPCAVKLIRPERAGRPDYLTLFEREVQSMAQLTHPNTVEVYDYGQTDDGTFFYVMEYLPGLSLDGLVRSSGPLPPGRVVYLLRQVCGALAEAHRQGLIHRDIKPGNIIVCERGDVQDVVKLLDFGLVHIDAALKGGGAPDAALDSPSEPASFSESGSRQSHTASQTQVDILVGTPAYMSPEQICGEQADARSDIYSMGGLAYFLLTGKPPFERPSIEEVCTAHVSEPVTPPRERDARIPADLSSVVLRCLAKERAARYQTAGELAQALAATQASGDWDSARAESWWRMRSSAGSLAPASIPQDGCADTIPSIGS